MPESLLILLAIFAWLSSGRGVKKQHLRPVPRLLVGALRVLGVVSSLLLLPLGLTFVYIYLYSSLSIRIVQMLIGIVFGGAALFRAGQFLLWGWRARTKEAVPPDPGAMKPWRPLANGGVLAVLAGVLTVVTISNALSPPIGNVARYRRAASGTKTAVTQAIVYASDKGVYPTSMKLLREAGYANIDDKDPWGRDWVLSPALIHGKKPGDHDEVYVYSTGPKGTGKYPPPSVEDTGEDGSVGYSSVYGAWSGK
jgi:hypothetical protein